MFAAPIYYFKLLLQCRSDQKLDDIGWLVSWNPVRSEGHIWDAAQSSLTVQILKQCVREALRRQVVWPTYA